MTNEPLKIRDRKRSKLNSAMHGHDFALCWQVFNGLVPGCDIHAHNHVSKLQVKSNGHRGEHIKFSPWCKCHNSIFKVRLTVSR
jgi:hypothetical protein